MKNFINYLISKLTLSEQKIGKEIGTRELGEKYCFLVLDRTKQIFNEHQVMEDLGIIKTNDSVREMHILNMFSIFNCIKYLRLSNDIKDSIINYIIDSYMDLLARYTREKGIDEETLLKEVESLKELIIERSKQYSEILKKYKTEALKNDKTGGNSKELEIGNDLIKVLNNITSHEYNDKNPFPSLYFFSLFMELIMDKYINDTINSDVHKYEIKKK